MIKEELEKEATEYVQKLESRDFIAKPKETVAYFGYLAGAEPREKRIKELEAQIEKMKCCENCENWNWKHSRCEKKLKGDCFKQSKWVLRKILSKEYE